MIHVELSEIYQRKQAILWSVLSFKTGMMNATGFLIAGTYVSHVTGFGTQVGIAIGHEEFDLGIELLVIPFSFIAGAMIAGWILDRNYKEDEIPPYPWVQCLITFLLGLISFLFSLGLFHKQAPVEPTLNSICLVGLLCLVCGLKNGLSTWASYGKIRTTHLTGLATDIGLHLPKLWMQPGKKCRYPESTTVNWVRILTFLSFSFGSAFAALLIPRLGYQIFHLIFGISLCLSAYSILHWVQSPVVLRRGAGSSETDVLNFVPESALQSSGLQAPSTSFHPDSIQTPWINSTERELG